MTQDTIKNRAIQFQRGQKDAKTKGAVFGASSEYGDEYPNLKRAYHNGYVSIKGGTPQNPGPEFKSSGRYYELLFYSQLTKKEQEELDYVKDDTNSFFRYKGHVYDLSEFSRILHPEDLKDSGSYHPMVLRDYHGHFDRWDCYQSDTHFSGIVARYKRDEDGEFDPEFIVIGTYYG